MKPLSFLIMVTIMVTSLYSQRPLNSQDILSRVYIDPIRRLNGSPDDVRAIYRLSKELVAPPMKDFKALSTQHQEVIIQAADESFEDGAYLEMVAAVLQCVADGSISPSVGRIALTPSSKEGVLAVNHADPRIAEVLPKLLARYRDDPDSTDLIQMLISGEAKQIHIESCESYGIKPAQVIAKVPPRGAAPSSLLNASAVPKNSPEVSTVPMASTEKTSSEMSWSILALLIIAAAGLLWWMLKRRS